MKVDCPYCRSESVNQMTDSVAHQLIEPVISEPLVLNRIISELFKSLNIHPIIKVVLNVALVVAVEHVTASSKSLSSNEQPYRCEDCQSVFTVFNQSV